MWKDLSLKVETGFGEFVQSVRPFLAWICVFSSLELLINEKVRLHYFLYFWCRENNDRAVSEIRICSIKQLESDSVAKPNPGAWTAARSLSSFPAWWMAAQSVNTLHHWGGWRGQEEQGEQWRRGRPTRRPRGSTRRQRRTRRLRKMASNMDEEQSLRECEAYVQMHGGFLLLTIFLGWSYDGIIPQAMLNICLT